MKKHALLCLFFLYGFGLLNAQILCIRCYNQNAPMSTNVTNLIQNGSFENSNCFATQNYSFCPSSAYYSCQIFNWLCSGGGQGTYAFMYNNSFSTIADGLYAPYFGNNFATACSIMFDLSCLSDSDCIVKGFPTGFPSSDSAYGGALGLSLSQVVFNLTPGDTFVLEFWAGGESYNGSFNNDGYFAVDVGFGNTFLRCPPTPPSTGIGKRYLVIFKATSAAHVFKFTSWGHFSPDCSELVLDDVMLYTIAELSPLVNTCWSLPDAYFSSANALCPGTCIGFTNLSSSSSTFQWSFPGATPDSSTVANPSNICYSATGNYNVTLVASNPNGSDTLTLQNYITVYPSPPPQSITQSGDTLFAIQGSSSYQWYFNGSIINGATDYFYTASASGDYNVVATDTNGCEVEAVLFGAVLSNESAVDENASYIFPNPVDGELGIGKMGNRSEVDHVAIYNTLGVRIPVSIDPQESTVDCRQLNPGIYFIEMSSAEKTYRTRFVKQ